MATILPALINGKVPEWADMIINILGVPMAGITNIEYEDKQEMENVYGAGSRPIGRVYKNYTPTAKITINMEELEAIVAVAPGRVIQRIPEFDITVAYVDDAYVPKIHTIRNCRFTSNGRKVQQGDGAIGCEIDIIISHVDF